MSSPARFYRATLSLHRLSDSAHLDLFLSSEKDCLLTYEAAEDATAPFFEAKPVAFTRKADHRTLYLDYEGPISDNRGQIEILWQGMYRLDAKSTPDKICVQFMEHQARDCLSIKEAS